MDSESCENTDPGNATDPVSDVETADSAPLPKKESREERQLALVRGQIQHNAAIAATALDISNKSIRKIPNELLELSHLEVC